MLITNLFFLLASFSDPGIIKGNKKLKFSKLVEKSEP